MSARRLQRRRRDRTRPGPELVAAGLVVILYAVGLGLGTGILASGPALTPPEPPSLSTPTPSPSASTIPLRGEISAILEIDARLTLAGDELRQILGRSPFRGSEVAFALRRIKPNLVAGAERIGELAAAPAAAEIGAQLEILYASANDTIDRASDLALGSDVAYRAAAREIVDLFTDLPAIDARLKALLEPGALDPSNAPSSGPSSSPSASPSVPTAPGSSPSPSIDPNELLRDPGFETVTGAWSLRTTGGSAPTVQAGAPLGTAGTRSIRIDVPAGNSLADAGIGQGPIVLHGGSPYVATVWIRATAPRKAQLRVVGPAEETYGIAVFGIGPETVQVRLDFDAALDEQSATFWIDFGGTDAGTVELDDASLVEVSTD